MDSDTGSSPRNSSLKDDDETDNSEILGTSSNSPLFRDNSPSVLDPSGSMKSEAYASPSSINKGFGLRKWRRIPRDSARRVDNSTNLVIEELPKPVLNPTKRRPGYSEKLQKNDAVSPLDPGSSKGSAADVETVSGQEQNSSGSTASSAVKMINFDVPPLVVGFSYDKSRLQHGQHGKPQIQAVKKPKGDKLRYSHKVYTSSNGNGARTSTHHDGENGDEAVVDKSNQVGDHDFSIDKQGEILHEDEAVKSSTEIQSETNENHGSHTDQDLLVEAISELKTAQEALGKELFMFKELSKDVEEPLSDSEKPRNEPGDESSKHFPSTGFGHSFSQAIESTDSVIRNRDFIATEKEALFRKRIEADVIYLVISGAVKELKSTASAQITTLPTTTTELRQHSESADTGNNNQDQDMAVSDETLMIQKRSVVRYISCLMFQLLMLFVIIRSLVSQSLSNGGENVPPT